MVEMKIYVYHLTAISVDDREGYYFSASFQFKNFALASTIVLKKLFHSKKRYMRLGFYQEMNCDFSCSGEFFISCMKGDRRTKNNQFDD